MLAVAARRAAHAGVWPAYLPAVYGQRFSAALGGGEPLPLPLPLPLAEATDYLPLHGHLAAPATPRVGAWPAEQRHLAATATLAADRAEARTALAPDWLLPHGADWHRKYHLLCAHLASGADEAAAGLMRWPAPLLEPPPFPLLCSLWWPSGPSRPWRVPGETGCDVPARGGMPRAGSDKVS
ncbi:hypothetical protein [Streptomyces sp. NPDC048650]|uniref:hypothetical protein n=1 Tax=Streptomyces sp. NPDC048650 TaxID=3365583 RepID=UPI0037187F42